MSKPKKVISLNKVREAKEESSFDREVAVAALDRAIEDLGDFKEIPEIKDAISYLDELADRL